MSNPWAKSFEDLRAPYLQEKKAKKDYDGDGKIESGTDEYKGSVDKAIKKSMAMRGKKKVAEHHQKDADGNTIPHENEGDGTPSSVEEVKKYGPGGGTLGDANDKVMKKLKDGTPVRKIDKKIKNLNMGEAKVDKRLPSGPFAGGAKDRSQARNLRKFGKKEGGDVPDKKGSHKYNPMASFEKRGNTEKLSKERRKEHEAKRGVKKEEVVLESDKKGKGSGTKDACYHKVKSRYSVWPSAYASGALVKCRKAGAKNWGNSSKKEDFDYYQMPMKSFDDLVGECWKTHERVPGTVKGAKGSCRPKGSAKMKEEVKPMTSVTGDGSKLSPRHTPGGDLSQFNADGTPKKKINVKKESIKITPHDISGGTKAGTDFMSGRKNPKTGKPVYKLSNPGGMRLKLAHYDWKSDIDYVQEALKGKKLEVKETGVKNKIEINPEIKTEAAKAPVKK